LTKFTATAAGSTGKRLRTKSSALAQSFLFFIYSRYHVAFVDLFLPSAVSQSNQYVRVIVDAPFEEPLDYAVGDSENVQVGQRCLVPLGRRSVIGIIVGKSGTTELPADKVKTVLKIFSEVSPLSENWLELTRFASRYYLSYWGRVAVPALPKFFRSKPNTAYDRAVKKILDASFVPAEGTGPAPQLNAEQQAALSELLPLNRFDVSVLFGITGSGKTEVYLRWMEEKLHQSEENQVLLMVPEINLTPQLFHRIQDRFPQFEVQTWHSGLSEGEKARSWLRIHEGRARILVGTRLSVLASFRRLSLIIIDEEHDASFKSQEGVRYSARDLAIKRAKTENIPILLGSATPSFETYLNALEGRFRLLKLTQRANHLARLPSLEIVNTKLDRPVEGISSRVREEIEAALDRREQAILFLNRRGYAPVVACPSCGWKSTCPHCSAFSVFHKTNGKLCCHHCGWTAPVPSACPNCGSVDLQPVGRGTQRIEEEIENSWPSAKILRLDQDSTRRKGSAAEAFEKIHRGEADLILGTQMVAKGHDFQKVSLVVILNSDSQLLSPDLRARERLFAVLLQVAGRAGRGDVRGKVLVQTDYPDDPLYKYLITQDYEGFARSELAARQETQMPPYCSQAVLVAEGKNIQEVLEFLKRCKNYALSLGHRGITLYDPVPLALVRKQDVDRGQLIIEGRTKVVLQAFLADLNDALRKIRTRFSWHIDVDPVQV
jgi:primosomal protein N' (replication factor Y)